MNEITRLRQRIGKLEQELRKRQNTGFSFKEIRAKIFEVANLDPKPIRPWPIRPPKGGSFAGTPTLALGDWHYGEKVSPGEAHGNRYDRRIALQRAKRVVEHTIDLVTYHMTGARADTMVVALLGDFISGEIHDELRVTNDGPLVSWIPEMVEILVGLLSTLIEALGVKLIIPCVSGNHGRNTKRIEYKRFGPSNFDWLIYTLTEREMRRSIHADKVAFIINDSNEAHWEVHGHRYMAVHGHDLGVRGGDGIIGPLGPIMRGRLKVLSQQRAIGREVDTLVMGHWHQYMTLPGLIVNGTLKGYDEFAAQALRAPPSPPVQALWFTHPKRGITCHWPVFAE